MVQPYLAAVDTYGETALMFFDGVFSHAIRKGPMLDGPDLGVPSGLYKPEASGPRTRLGGRAGAGRRGCWRALPPVSRRRFTRGST